MELGVNAEGSDNIHGLYIYFLIFRVLNSIILIFQTMNPCSIFYQLPESFFCKKCIHQGILYMYILSIESWTLN